MSMQSDGALIVRAMLVLRETSDPEDEVTLRRAVEAVGSYEGAAFIGDDSVSRGFLEGGSPWSDLSVMLRHPTLTEVSDEHNGWTKVKLARDRHRNEKYLFVSINVGRVGHQIEVQWRVGLTIVPRVVAKLHPYVAYLNAHLIDEEYEAFPDPPTHPTHLPTALTPWTYVAAPKESGPKYPERLRAIPAARVTPLNQGIAVQVVERLDDATPPEFIDALGVIQPPLRYIPPQLPGNRQ